MAARRREFNDCLAHEQPEPMAAQPLYYADGRRNSRGGPGLSAAAFGKNVGCCRFVSSLVQGRRAALELGLAGKHDAEARRIKNVAPGNSHGHSRAGFPLVRFRSTDGNRAGRGGVVHERIDFAGHNVPHPLDMEPDEPHGTAADIGHGRGLHDLHSIGPTPARRRPGRRPAFRRTGIDALRGDCGDGICFTGHVQQSRHGQPGASLRRGHLRKRAHLGVFAASMVAAGQALSGN